jgi:hypothetical protein
VGWAEPAVMTRDIGGLLEEYLSSARGNPFEWGRHDCVMFAANWVRFCTPRDPAARWRGRYATRMEAARRIKEAGADSMVAAGDILFGAARALDRSIDARRGDIGLSNGAFGIVTGASAIFLKPTVGVTSVPVRQLEKVWAL